MSRIVYYMEVSGLDVAGAATQFYFGTESSSTSPTRTVLPNTFIDGRLSQPLSFKRDMFGPNQTRGTIGIANGTVTLENPDGALDYLASYGFDGRKIVIHSFDTDTPGTDVVLWSGLTESVLLTENEVIFTVREGTYALDLPIQESKYQGTNALPNGLDGTPSDLKGQPKPIWYGTVFNAQPPIVNTSRLIYQLDYIGVLTPTYSYSLTVYDSRVALTQGMQLTSAQLNSDSSVQACNNDQATPSLFTTCTDTTYATPQAHGLTTGDRVNFTFAPTGHVSAPLATGTYYYVRVLSTTTFNLFSTRADALANTSPIHCSQFPGLQSVVSNCTLPGIYDYFTGRDSGSSGTLSGFYIRLGSKAIGEVTFDGTRNDSDTPYLAFNNAIAKAAARTGIVYASGTSTVGVTPNAAIANQAFGIFITEEANMLAVIGQIVASMGASFGHYQPTTGTSITRVIATRIEPGTSETALLTLSDSDVIAGSFRRVDPGDPERGTPATRCNLQYAKNYTVQTGTQVAGAALDPAFVALPYRTLARNNSAILSQFPAAPQISMDTLLSDSASATLQSAYYVGSSAASLYSKKRDVYIVKISLDRVLADLTTSLITVDGTFTMKGINGLIMGKPIALALTRVTRTCWLIGYEVDVQANTVQLTLWG